MIRGMYGATTALNTASKAQDVIAQNLAHATVPGYRARGLAFETFDHTLSKQVAPTSPLGVQVSRDYSDFRPGALQFTGQKLDVALDGDSFFVVQGPKGPLYTRDGVFQRSANGQLQTTSGLALMGADGPIALPAGASDIVIGRDGAVRADNNLVGQMRLARFAEPNRLVPAGTALFSAPAGVQSEVGKSSVLQGYRELANVQPATELVAMIRNSRYFEAAQRALRTLSESIQLNTRPQ